MEKIKALALFSGGLDSILACRVIMNQGIEVKALHFITPFFGYNKKGREKEVGNLIFKKYGITLEIVDVSNDYLKVVKHPQHGYGKNLNPCVDCKIFLFAQAKKHLEKEGASFLITGEVLGQRPMSQRRDTLRIIERDSGTDGILLRPLCAKHLKPTIPEERGWVDRDKLLDLQGRGRTPQMKLAARLGITEYPTPAGGCILTDANIAARIRWLFTHIPDTGVQDVLLTTVGRHFALGQKTLLVVGRFEKENEQITQLSQAGDIQIELTDKPGPLSLLRGPCTHEILKAASSITARYSKAREEQQVTVSCKTQGSPHTQELVVAPITDRLLDEYKIV
jgi:tRNA U34 2-thiouridine synthase MnmA/TrmU